MDKKPMKPILVCYPIKLHYQLKAEIIIRELKSNVKIKIRFWLKIISIKIYDKFIINIKSCEINKNNNFMAIFYGHFILTF